MSSTQLYLATAEQHLAAGEWADAEQAAVAGLRAHPDHGGLHEAAGIAAYRQEEYGAALFHLEAATTLAPLGVESRLLLADLYLRFGQTQAAAAILEFLAEPDRCPTPLLPELARTLGRAGRCEAALEVCQRLTALRPNFHPAWFGVAYYLRQLGRPAEQAAFPLRMAHQLAPSAVVYRVHLAAVAVDTGHPTEAYRLIAAVPPDVLACECLCRRFATACAAVGDGERAAAFRRRAAQLTPDDSVSRPSIRKGRSS